MMSIKSEKFNIDDIMNSREVEDFVRTLSEFIDIHFVITEGVPGDLSVENVAVGGRTFKFTGDNHSFCDLIQTTPAGAERCLKCKQDAQKRSAAEKRTIKYICHAGLVEFVVPLFTDSRLRAFIECGQLLPKKPNRTNFKEIWSRIEDLGVDRDQVFGGYLKINFVNEQKQDAIADLLKLFSDYISEIGIRLHPVHPETENPDIDKAIQFIKNNFKTPITLKDIAENTSLTASYLSWLIKKSTGYNYLQYLHYLRIGEAKKLLKTTEMPITEVCYQSGFNEISHFYHVFRKNTKCTPKEYREMYKRIILREYESIEKNNKDFP